MVEWNPECVPLISWGCQTCDIRYIARQAVSVLLGRFFFYGAGGPRSVYPLVQIHTLVGSGAVQQRLWGRVVFVRLWSGRRNDDAAIRAERGANLVVWPKGVVVQNLVVMVLIRRGPGQGHRFETGNREDGVAGKAPNPAAEVSICLIMKLISFKLECIILAAYENTRPG